MMLLPLAAELSRVFNEEIQKYQKQWEVNRPEKITFTFINGSHSLKPVKKLIVIPSFEVDLRE
jgi:hypothetical protein